MTLYKRVEQFLVEAGAEVPRLGEDIAVTRFLPYQFHIAGERRYSWIDFSKEPFLDFVFLLSEDENEYLKRLGSQAEEIVLMGYVFSLGECVHYGIRQALTEADCDSLLRIIVSTAEAEIATLDQLSAHSTPRVPKDQPSWVGHEVSRV